VGYCRSASSNRSHPLLRLVGYSCVWALAYSAKAQETALVTRQGAVIRFHPFNVSLTIPTAWTTWYDSNHNNLHLTPPDLAKVRTAEGNWDRDYAQVVNAVLPFENCVTHVGAEGWGHDSYSMADLQARVYFVDWPSNKVKQRIAVNGVSTARAISKRETGASNRKDVFVVNNNWGKWQRSVIRFGVRYHDPVDEVQGTAFVEFYTQPLRRYTMVLAFMYANPESSVEDIRSIVSSVRLIDENERPKESTPRIRSDLPN
jgi:hypothetical protein